jgi:hypothetical protein
MRNQSSSLVAAFGLLAGITGCAVTPDDVGDTSSVEQQTFIGDLGNSQGTPVTTGNTMGRTNDFIPTCVVSSRAPDVTYTWTAPFNGTFTFTTTGSLYDTVLELRAFNTLASLGCNDDNGTLQSTVIASLPVGQTILVVVDGFSTDAGSYRVNITPNLLDAVPVATAVSGSERQVIDAAIARKHAQQ